MKIEFPILQQSPIKTAKELVLAIWKITWVYLVIYLAILSVVLFKFRGVIFERILNVF